MSQAGFLHFGQRHGLPKMRGIQRCSHRLHVLGVIALLIRKVTVYMNSIDYAPTNSQAKNNMNDEKKYPQLIRQLRKRIGVSQEKFASQVGVVLATIYRYEGGKSDPDPPILATLIQLAEKEAPDIAAPLRDEYLRLFGAPAGAAGLAPEREALLGSIRALLADERFARKVSGKLSSILLDMQEKSQNGIAPRKKTR